MFWGLIMEPQKKYTQTVKKAFHISMAALDNTSATDELVQVLCGYENRKYLLCSLQKDKVFQCALDLTFEVGSEISFVTNGKSHVHLSGYLIPDDDMMQDMLGDEEDDEADISLGNVSSSNIVSGKRSKTSKAEGQQNGLSVKLGKKLAELAKDAPASKKMKTADLLLSVEEDEDDEDDSDVDLSDLLGEEEEDDDEEADTVMDEDVDDEEDDDEEEDDEDDDEEDEEEDDDDDDEDEDEEESAAEEDEVFDIPPQNGLAKKSKKDAKKKVDAKSESKSPKAEKTLPTKSPKKVMEGGVQIEDLRVGSGAPAKPGKMLQLYYEGRFKTNNKVFDATTKGPGFKFRLGRGEVIKGWDVGLTGMKVGGKRRIVCPPSMAYGSKGSPPTIPPNSTLVFEVELQKVT